MRVIWLLAAFAAVGLAGEGKFPIDATVKKRFMDILKEATSETEKIEKLSKLVNLPGNANNKKMTVILRLVRLSQLFYNNTDSDIWKKVFDTFIEFAFDQKTLNISEIVKTRWPSLIEGEQQKQHEDFAIHLLDRIKEIHNMTYGNDCNHKKGCDDTTNIDKQEKPNTIKKEAESCVSAILSSNHSVEEQHHSIVTLLGDCKKAHECVDEILADEKEKNISCAFGALASCAVTEILPITPNEHQNVEINTYLRYIFILKTQMDQLFIEETLPVVKEAYNNFIKFFFNLFAKEVIQHGTFVDPMPLVKIYVTQQCESQFESQESFEYCTQYRRVHSIFMRLYKIVTTSYKEWDQIYAQFLNGSIDAALENSIVGRHLEDQLHSPRTFPNVRIFGDLTLRLRELHKIGCDSPVVICNIRANANAAILAIHSILSNTTRTQLDRHLNMCPDILYLPPVDWNSTLFQTTTPTPMGISTTSAPSKTSSSPETTLPPISTSLSPTTTPVTEWCFIVAARLELIIEILNNPRMKACDKLAKTAELGLTPGTPQYEAFKYLIYVRDLYQVGVFKGVIQNLTTYNKLIFDELQIGYLHNRTCDVKNCLTVRNTTKFELTDENRTALIEIEDIVLNGIYIVEHELPAKIIHMTANNSINSKERVQQIVALLNITGTESDIWALITTYVEAVKYKDYLEREKGEKLTTALLKHLELVIAGSIREGVLLPLDICQYENILDYLKNVFHYEILLNVTRTIMEPKLTNSGLNSDLRQFFILQLSQLSITQLEVLHESLVKFDICPVSATTNGYDFTTTTTTTTTHPITQGVACNCSELVIPHRPYQPFYPMKIPPTTYPYPTRVTFEYGYPYAPYPGEYHQRFPYENCNYLKTRRSVNSKGENELVKHLMKRPKPQTVHEFYAAINKASRIGQF